MSTILVKDLLKCHKDYNPARVLPSGKSRGVLSVNQELYEGGIAFGHNKQDYLRPRVADSDPKYLQTRLACAEFTPTAGPIIDWASGQCVIDMPRIESSDEYYSELTEDMDGNGTDLEQQARELAKAAMVHFRAYIAVDFPNNDPSATNLKDAKGSGGLDAQICMYSPEMVEDWTYDKTGNLNFVRTHTCEIPQVNNLPGDVELHTWTFIHSDSSQAYTAEKKATQKEWPSTAEATSQAKVIYDYGGQLPVIQPQFEDGLHAMDRVAGAEIDVFNLATGLTFLDEMVCFQQLVITIEGGEAKGIVTSEKSAIILPIGATAAWMGPQVAPLDSIDRQVDAKRLKIKDTLLSIGLTSQNDRYGQQSGEAKKQAAQPAVDMLSCYKAPIKDAYEKALNLIKYVRKDENIEIKILGLGGIEDKEAKAEEALANQQAQVDINKPNKPVDNSTQKD